MNRLKHIALLQAFTWLVFVTDTNVTMVPFEEDGYAMQAPEQLLSIAEKAAHLVNFTTKYEVIVPKKSGIQVNPWNKFTAYGINPGTQNPFILINQEWFNTLPEDQQLFLLGRNFITLQHSATTPLIKMIPYLLIKMIPYLHMLLIVMLICLLLWLLGKTPLRSHKVWIRVLIAYALVTALNFAVLNSLQVTIMQYLGRQFDIQIIKAVVEKTNNNDAAIKALEYFDSSIKDEINNGETFFVPLKDLFGTYAQQIQR